VQKLSELAIWTFSTGSATACATVDTRPVKFQTEVKTTAEQQLAQAVEAMINAYNNRDIKKHVSYYAPDAKIESLRAGGTVSRDQYESTLLGSLANLPFIKLHGCPRKDFVEQDN